MLIEKLFFHLLITLMPVLCYSFFFERKPITQSPYFIGGLYSISAAFCMTFAYYEGGLFWDLRYVPLILAFLYGGRKAGLMVTAVECIMRITVGGDAALLAVGGILVVASIPFLCVTYYEQADSNNRLKVTVLLGGWPAVIQMTILFSYTIMYRQFDGAFQQTFYHLLLFACIQLIGTCMAAKLIELYIERIRMKEEIERAEKLNTMGELAASIAHEVRNPLTVVKGFLQLMQKEEDAHKQPYLPLVLSELGRAEVIISDYLNFAKPEFKKIEVFSIPNVLTDIVLLLNALAVKNGVELHEEIQNNAFLLSDRNQLKQALVNFVKNAIEATPEGGTVHVCFFVKGQQAYIRIQDTGKGMTKEQLDKIGTLFYTTKEKGTGLGTAVSVRIIESMNGKVTFMSEQHKGTEVRIQLPISSHVTESLQSEGHVAF
ncbi:sporulation kinase b [Fictibacillus macauensis ZFHKF-1]|uniref:histidine kinase n=1 Tax=Fictibacillus macauensis ZFHKF-1 TaxID=1196324 RepID=I8IZ21_9BACL|nr:HAMP domain-containing sensor histidine kinase [Fictibacillus macauensis]EIT84736.1 sporulation kinase b [Fictibacillus macauensis ZFHKF-1]